MPRSRQKTTNVTALRHTLELSQERLAAQCGLAMATIQRFEAAETEGSLRAIQQANVETILKLSEGLGVTPLRLWDGFGKVYESDE